MGGLSLILETARKGLNAQQVGISVTGHNIANASTDGYSRQRLSLTASSPLKETYGYLGTGVTTASITRVRDQMLDQQIRYNNSILGSANSTYEALSEVESSFDEPSDSGLSTAMSNLFSSFQTLATYPEESSSRTSVIETAQSLCQVFHRLSSEITSEQASVADATTSKVSSINDLTKSIASLNAQIAAANATGSEPNDLEDSRDAQLKELSNLTNITVSEDDNGAMIVSIGGTEVISNGSSTELKANITSTGLQVVTAKGGNAVNISSGEVGGDLTLYNTTLPGYLDQLDTLAGALIDRINTLHSAGYGIGTTPSTGNVFFSGSTAADISVSSTIVSDPSLIAASSDGTSGDNTVALSLANVADEDLLNGDTMTLDEYYNSLVSTIGSDVNSATADQTSQTLVIQQLENEQASVAGVSLDEEMTNLIEYQKAYSAAAKVVTTANEMFDTILNMV